MIYIKGFILFVYDLKTVHVITYKQVKSTYQINYVQPSNSLFCTIFLGIVQFK